MVTATGTAAVDTQVVTDATAAGVLVNSADGDSPGTVTLPAVHRQGAVTIGVSTGGASPALARWLRNRIAADLPAELATVALLLAEMRDRRVAGSPAGTVDWETLIEARADSPGGGRAHRRGAGPSGGTRGAFRTAAAIVIPRPQNCVPPARAPTGAPR